jgi:HAD superfamily hydrolase (TIGR01509 family)
MPRIPNQFLKPRTSIIKFIQSCIWPHVKHQIPRAVQSSKTSVIFDLDGVLCRTNTLQALREIGIILTLKFIAEQWRLPSQTEFYQKLMNTPAKSKIKSFITDTLRMPQIVVDWQCGLQPIADIQAAMINHINNSQLTAIEKKFWIKAIMLQTTPETLIASRCLIPGAVKFLRDLKSAGYNLYVISNWDPLSFPLLKKQFPGIFTYQGKKMFEATMTSGKAGIVKPYHTIFEKSLLDFELLASDAIFIDDVIENVHTAQKIGMQAIHCIDHKIKNVKIDLINILKNSKKH